MHQTPNHPLDPLAVVTHPERYTRCPIVMADAWGALKQARGQTVDYSKTGPMAYQIDPAPRSPEPSAAEITQRCAGRATAIATRKGWPTPGDAA